MGKHKKHNLSRADYLYLTLFMLICAALLVESFIYFSSGSIYIKLTAYIGIPIVLCSGLIFFIFNKKPFFRLLFSSIAMLEFGMIVYIILQAVGVLDTLTDVEQIRKLIQSTGMWGMLVFCLVQLFQVVVLPVPAIVFYIVGLALYGASTTFILSTISVCLGSMICFGIGRLAGEKVVGWIAGEDAAKYRRFLGEKGKYAIIIMLLFPFFPDDMLCMIAGLTTMSWLYFGIVVVITRTINVAVTCYFGSGDIIPFSGWGIGVWIAIALAVVVGFILIKRFQDKLFAYFFGEDKRKLISRPQVYSVNLRPLVKEPIQVHADKEM